MLKDIFDTLQAPKNLLWSMLPGLHDENTGEAYQGSQVASNLLGTDPDSVWSKALGFGLDVAGDPLALAAPLVGRGAGALAKVLGAGGEAAEALPGALKLSESAAPAGWDAAEGFTHRSLGRGTMGSNYSRLKGLRNQFGMMTNMAEVPPEEAAGIKDMIYGSGEVGPRTQLTPQAKMVGELSGPVDPDWSLMAMEAAEPRLGNGASGAFVSTPNSPVSHGLGFAGDPATLRHELVHGMINSAALSGDTSGLPLAMRIPAWLRQSESPFVRGVGGIFDEAAAHGLENRGLMNQAKGYLSFLADPSPGYYSQIGETSPLAAAMWRTAPAAAAFTGGTYAYLKGRQMFDQ